MDGSRSSHTQLSLLFSPDTMGGRAREAGAGRGAAGRSGHHCPAQGAPSPARGPSAPARNCALVPSAPRSRWRLHTGSSSRCGPRTASPGACGPAAPARRAPSPSASNLHSWAWGGDTDSSAFRLGVRPAGAIHVRLSIWSAPRPTRAQAGRSRPLCLHRGARFPALRAPPSAPGQAPSPQRGDRPPHPGPPRPRTARRPGRPPQAGHLLRLPLGRLVWSS
ncbi:translation initiation factor IF-2-like [Nycticebus coucang]|uniref:translation initiation factor IF-2-like n=1 Tax=Nycticebus coucang TaxID=9470 RepID=UPI00234C5FF9|nr:translation initiation factor IF-2-like [Nycticebus coucang]